MSNPAMANMMSGLMGVSLVLLFRNCFSTPLLTPYVLVNTTSCAREPTPAAKVSSFSNVYSAIRTSTLIQPCFLPIVPDLGSLINTVYVSLVNVMCFVCTYLYVLCALTTDAKCMRCGDRTTQLSANPGLAEQLGSALNATHEADSTANNNEDTPGIHPLSYYTAPHPRQSLVTPCS